MYIAQTNPNALDAIVPSEHFENTSETVCAGCWVPDEIPE